MKVKENGKIEWIMVKKHILNGCLFVKQDCDPYQIYRAIPYGSNIDLVMLDTRLHGRDVQAGTTGAVVESPTREY
jgi:hypothetical protein